MTSNQENKLNHHVLKWIYTLTIMILMMVVIGGITRLTGSGLSIVEWKPLMGAIPPLNHEQWLEVFLKYQQSPQYQLVNKGMSLPEFQWIFFWEYTHRLIGRTLGLIFLIPLIYFYSKKILSKKWVLKLSIGFGLGGLQGVMGWVMVASGLVSEPQVSHYRLAAHLLLALGILIYFLKLSFNWKSEQLSNSKVALANNNQNDLDLDLDLNSNLNLLSVPFNILLGLIIFQIFYGALVAGLRAGFMMPTFPLMGGQFFPNGGMLFTPIWKNFFENPLTVQWIHRIIAWLIFFSIWIIFIKFNKILSRQLKNNFLILFGLVNFQFFLGILTLISGVYIPFAVLHQLTAFIVAMAAFQTKWSLQKEVKQTIIN